jgi:hypothetical protein
MSPPARSMYFSCTTFAASCERERECKRKRDDAGLFALWLDSCAKSAARHADTSHHLQRERGTKQLTCKSEVHSPQSNGPVVREPSISTSLRSLRA